MKNRIKERAKKVPTDVRIMVNKSMATAKCISEILEKQGKTQKNLADLLGKKESEVSKWLRGTHNFTYRTISKIEAALGEQIILTANQSIQNINIIKAVVADNKEQALCFIPNQETHYMIFENGKQLNFTQSLSSVTKSSNKVQLNNLCVAN